MDRPLPGFEPAYIRIDVTRTPAEGYSVRVFACEGPGFVAVADSDLYESLVAFEVTDVVAASLMTLLRL